MTSTCSELAFRPNGAARLRAWLSVRHPIHVEAAAVVGLYAAYEVARGLAVGNASEADRHAHRIASLERALHLFLESDVQSVARALPGLTGLLGGAYLTLHLAVTSVVLLWLHRRRPATFPFARTAFLLASMLALVGFVLYPTAPPRLAGVGVADTISSDRIDINHGLVSALYNPYAAVPSMHIAYALLVAGAVLVATRRRLVRAAALLYPLAVLFIVVATGNHFFLDAAAGAASAAVAAAVATVLTRGGATAPVVPLAARTTAMPQDERRAA